MPAPFDGFGIDANFTIIDSEIDLTGTALARFNKDRAGENLPFFRQPDWIGNVALWYQRGRLAGRIAVRFQDSQVDELEGFAAVDTWSAEQTFWDAQISYRMTDNWSFYGNIQNIGNNLDDRWQGNDSSRIKDREEFGSTYRFGLRWNY